MKSQMWSSFASRAGSPSGASQRMQDQAEVVAIIQKVQLWCMRGIHGGQRSCKDDFAVRLDCCCSADTGHRRMNNLSSAATAA